MDGGSGGKNPLRTILQIAVIAAAAAVGAGALGGSFLAGGSATLFTAGTTSAALAGAAVGIIGNLALNALIPPPRQQLSAGGETESATLSVTATRNEKRTDAVIPKLFGRQRTFPPFGADPFWESVGDDMYVNMLFTVGFGPLNMSDFRIGETPLGNFTDYQIEIRPGWPDDAPLTLYRNDVDQQTFNDLLEAGVPVVRETAADTDEIIFDLGFQGLATIDDNGNRQNRTVEVSVEYREAGAGTWKKTGITETAPVRQQGIVANQNANTVVSFIGAPNGQIYSLYRTGFPVWNGLKVTLNCPRQHGTTALWGIKYRVWVRPLGETAWTLMLDMGDFLRRDAGSRIFEIPVTQQGKVTELRIEIKEYSWYTNTARLPATNVPGIGLFGERTPQPLAWEYNRLVAENVNRFTARSTQLVRRSVRIPTGSTERYEVRLTRITPDATSDRVLDKVYLTSLKSIRYTNPVQFDVPGQGLAQIALRIKTNDLTSGQLESFNLIAEALLPVSADGVTWSHGVTRNPAWAFCDVLRGLANDRPQLDTALDFLAIKAWADFCDAPAAVPAIALPPEVELETGEPAFTYDFEINSDTTLDELLRQIAATGRGTYFLDFFRWTVAFDAPGKEPVQHFTPFNSRDFRGTLSLAELPHALRVRFRNRNKNWEQDELVVYREGYSDANARRFETLEMPTVTSAAQAWRAARYHFADAQLRRETVEITVDHENLLCRPGDLVYVSHDVVSWGLGHGWIRAVTLNGGGEATHLTVDQPFVMAAGSTYGVRLRLFDGALLHKSALE